MSNNNNNSTSNVNEPLRGFMPGVSGRGTLDILWSCVSVLVLNTWTVLHLNIPPKNMTSGRRWLHFLKWWVICMFAPDAIACAAFSEWRLARQSIERYQGRLPWWRIQHGFYAEMGGYRIRDETTGQEYAFRSKQLAWLLEKGLIELPEVPIEDLADRSKADTLAKILTCGQSAWFVMQAIARYSQSLAFTTLEVETLPFVGVAAMTYCCWWHKPYDMKTCTLVLAQSLPPDKLKQMAVDTCNPQRHGRLWRPAPKELHERGWNFYWMDEPWDLEAFKPISANTTIPPEVEDAVRDTTAVRNVLDWYLPSVNETHYHEGGVLDDFVIWSVGILFSLMQVTAWNFRFPSSTEKLLWRIASIMMMGTTTMLAPFALFFSLFAERNSMVKHIPTYFLVATYALFRSYIIVEIFVGLRALPPDVFKTVPWSTYFPHFF